eukprot:1927993-Amphidinium_carterae.1
MVQHLEVRNNNETFAQGKDRPWLQLSSLCTPSSSVRSVCALERLKCGTVQANIQWMNTDSKGLKPLLPEKAAARFNAGATVSGASQTDPRLTLQLDRLKEPRCWSKKRGPIYKRRQPHGNVNERKSPLMLRSLHPDKIFCGFLNFVAPVQNNKACVWTSRVSLAVKKYFAHGEHAEEIKAILERFNQGQNWDRCHARYQVQLSSLHKEAVLEKAAGLHPGLASAPVRRPLQWWPRPKHPLAAQNALAVHQLCGSLLKLLRLSDTICILAALNNTCELSRS